MQFSILALATIASGAFAQTLTTSALPGASTTCAAQNILEACKSTINGQVASCQGNDWDCLCTQYQNLLTCYNNCPGDAVRPSVQQQVDQYCAAAKTYGTTTKAASGSSTAVVAAQTTSAAATTTASSTSKASPTSSGNAAASLEVSASLIAIVLAGLGLVA